jgi:hypothetical protein
MSATTCPINKRVAALVLGLLWASPAWATIYTPANAGALTTALSTVNCGDTIKLTRSTTYTGNFSLRNAGTCGSNWIYITTNTPGDQPAAGVRVGAANFAVMPKIVTDNSQPAITWTPGSNGYRFVFVEVASSYTGDTYGPQNLILSGEDGSGFVVTTLTDLPKNAYYDQVYVHGNDFGGIGRGINCNVQGFTLVNSYVAKIHRVGSESWAVACWQPAGGGTVTNNYIEAGSQAMLFGGDCGSCPLGPAGTANGWTVNNNFMTNDMTEADWCSSGSVPGCNGSTYAGRPWLNKNIFEVKNGKNFSIYHNIFERSWPAGGQQGGIVLFTSLNDSGFCPFCTLSNIDFHDNIVRHGNIALQFVGHSGYSPPCPSPCDSTPIDGVNVHNNLLYDINGNIWQGVYSWCWQLGASPRNLTFAHNTCDTDGASNVGYSIPLLTTPDEQIPGFVMSNNLIQGSADGIKGSSSGSAKVALDAYMTAGYTFLKNVFAVTNALTWPATTITTSTATFNASFVNRSIGDYRLLSTSPFHNAATDGTDIGVNMGNGLFPDPAGDGNTTLGASTPPPSPPPPAPPPPAPPPPGPIRIRVVCNETPPLTGAVVEGPASVHLCGNGSVSGFAMLVDGARQPLAMTRDGHADSLGTPEYAGSVLLPVGNHTLQFLGIYGTAGDGPLSAPFSVSVTARAPTPPPVPPPVVEPPAPPTPCSYALRVSAQTFARPGGSAAVQITTAAGCPWTVAEAVDWLTASPRAGLGSSTVQLQVKRFNGRGMRTASVAVAGHAFFVQQAGK